tara:strand:+ start:341 stop:943 length:603 start_codon:yes stop_codon:yes gene_type:complete
MKKQIIWQDVILKKIKIVFFFFIFSTISNFSFASDRWVVDKTLSTIEFELPVLFAKNVKGRFNSIDGYVEIDINTKKNNKAIFSVLIEDIEINYSKYKDLVLSDLFFDEKNFPKALLDTKKFSYTDEDELEIEVELSIKGKNQMIPLIINIIQLAEEVVQIQSELIFSRNSFNIGTGNWRNTTILKDNIKLNTNIFLFKE